MYLSLLLLFIIRSSTAVLIKFVKTIAPPAIRAVGRSGWYSLSHRPLAGLIDVCARIIGRTLVSVGVQLLLHLLSP